MFDAAFVFTSPSFCNVSGCIYRRWPSGVALIWEVALFVQPTFYSALIILTILICFVGRVGGCGVGGDNFVHDDFRHSKLRRLSVEMWASDCGVQDFQHFAPTQSAKMRWLSLAPARHTAARRGYTTCRCSRKVTKLSTPPLPQFSLLNIYILAKKC